MVLFAVDEGKEEYCGRAVRASILAHSCLMQGLEVAFVCADHEVYDCLKRGGFPRIHLTDEGGLLTDSVAESPSFLIWDAARPLTHKDVAHCHQHEVLVLEFDAADGKSYADEVVNGFEPTLFSALGRRYRLVGPNYFVVDKWFSNAKEWRRAETFLHKGTDLFICFHGAAPEQLLQPTLQALAEIPACRSIQIRAMTRLEGKEGRTLQRKFSAAKNLQIYTEANAALAAQFMRFSCLGIISFGPLLVEAMAAELPVLLINSTEANEERAAKALNTVFVGAGRTYGYSSKIDWDRFRRELPWLLKRPLEIERMQTAARRLVDGQGAQRIARYIHNYLENRGRGHGARVRGKEPRSMTFPLGKESGQN
jgi:spore coat polysaccharide biosynthesis predicted glycosyltransferase SpsG